MRIVIRELQDAPRLLQEWDLIEPADGGYRFRVELLRRWLAEYKPLRRVQEELDRIEPVAENFYRAALGLYRARDLEQAVESLRRALGLNPNHLGATELLADIFLAQGKPEEARQLLEPLHERQPAVRPRLIQALLALAENTTEEDKQLDFYDKVLELDARCPEAIAGKQQIWKQRGDRARAKGDLKGALEAYEKAGLKEQITETRLDIQLEERDGLERNQEYQKALDKTRHLSEDFPGRRDWQPDLERLEHLTRLAGLYPRAVDAYEKKDLLTACELLRQIVCIDVTTCELLRQIVRTDDRYEKAASYLHRVVVRMREESKTSETIPIQHPTGDLNPVRTTGSRTLPTPPQSAPVHQGRDPSAEEGRIFQTSVLFFILTGAVLLSLLALVTAGYFIIWPMIRTPVVVPGSSPTATYTPTVDLVISSPPPGSVSNPEVTSTPRPTMTSTSTPTTEPTCTPTVVYPAPTLLVPAPGEVLTSKYPVRFEWQWDGPPLPENAKFDLRIRSEKQREMREGAVEPTTGTSTVVDLQYVPVIKKYGPGRYFWTVVVMDTQTRKVVGEWGEEREFSYSQ